MIVRKIISGGQTGVDIAAIDTAIELGLDWGGWVPRGRPQELGKTIPGSYDRFTEHDSRDWLARTRANVNDATATLVLVSHRQYVLTCPSNPMVQRIAELTAERDEWKRRAIAHGCDADRGDEDCG